MELEMGNQWHPTEENYWKLKAEYRDLENRYTVLCNKYGEESKTKSYTYLTVEERRELESGEWLECTEPTEDDYWKLEAAYRDMENCHIALYNKYCREPWKPKSHFTDEERRELVSGKWIECIKPITNVRKGSGCKVGEGYMFEYVHDTEENPDAEAFYRKLSDNDHYDEVYITDKELYENFNWKELYTYNELRHNKI